MDTIIKILGGALAICIGLSSFYFIASGISIVLDVELLYGFIIPPVIALFMGFIPILNILQPIMYILLIIAGVIGFINVF